MCMCAVQVLAYPFETNGGGAMSFEARRRTDHSVRLKSQVNRGRSTHTHLSVVPPKSTEATRQASAPPVRRIAPARALPEGGGRLASRWTTTESGRLLSRWTTNESGRLVMV